MVFINKKKYSNYRLIYDLTYQKGLRLGAAICLVSAILGLIYDLTYQKGLRHMRCQDGV